MAMYIPNAQIGPLGETIASQCQELGIEARDLYAELSAPTERRRGRVDDIQNHLTLSTSDNMADYKEQIAIAIQATTKAYDACGYFLPAHVLNLHFRRLKRLNRAVSSALDADYQQTDSDGSADSNRHTPYRPPKRRQAEGQGNNQRPPPKHYKPSYTTQPPTDRSSYTSYAETRHRQSSSPSLTRRARDSHNPRDATYRRPPTQARHAHQQETPRRQSDQGKRR